MTLRRKAQNKHTVKRNRARRDRLYTLLRLDEITGTCSMYTDGEKRKFADFSISFSAIMIRG